MKRPRLNRRTFLKGVGGAAVALPFLEAMEAPARAEADGPCRYVVMFAGIPNRARHLIVPDETGPSWTPTRALSPLADAGVGADVSVVSNLVIPWANDRSSMRPGGRFYDLHGRGRPPLVSGTQGTDPDDDSYGRTFPEASTSDQIVADAYEGQTYLRSVEYRVQARGYRGGDSKSLISAQRVDDGSVQIRTPITSPRLAFDALFNNPAFAPDDPAELARRERQWARRRSVLDNVRSASERLGARLGIADQRRLERHFDAVRDLERRLADPPELTAQCSALPDPGEDPSSEYTTSRQSGEDRTIGYSNEDWRADRMVELLHMAFACDLTRSATLLLTYFQSFMNVEQLIGLRRDAHEVGHRSGSDEQSADLFGWHVGKLADLLRLMKDTDEGGRTMLDTSAVVFLNEAGWGADPQSGSDDSAHSTENMMVLLAGHAGGLLSGQHIDGAGRHPGSVIRSAMRAVGVDAPLGQVTEDVPELFGG